MSISGQIVSEIVAQLCLENSIQTLLIFFGSTQKKLERFVWSVLSITDHTCLFHESLKKLPVVEGYFGSWGHAFVAIVERFK